MIVDNIFKENKTQVRASVNLLMTQWTPRWQNDDGEKKRLDEIPWLKIDRGVIGRYEVNELIGGLEIYVWVARE